MNWLHPHQVGVDGPRALSMPQGAPEVAARIFRICTSVDPGARPTASQVVAMLQSSQNLALSFLITS